MTHDAAARAEELARAAYGRLLAILAASVIMGAVVWALAYGMAAWFEPANGVIVQVASLVLLVSAGLAVYAGVAAALGALDAKSLLARLSAS